MSFGVARTVRSPNSPGVKNLKGLTTPSSGPDLRCEEDGKECYNPSPYFTLTPDKYKQQGKYFYLNSIPYEDKTYSNPVKISEGSYGYIYGYSSPDDDRKFAIKYAKKNDPGRVTFDYYMAAYFFNNPKVAEECRVEIPVDYGTVAFSTKDNLYDIIVMKQADGDLRNLVNSNSFSIENKLEALNSIEKMVMCLSHKGIYYTDLKMANVLYYKEADGSYNYYLGDHGSAMVNTSVNHHILLTCTH